MPRVNLLNLLMKSCISALGECQLLLEKVGPTFEQSSAQKYQWLQQWSSALTHLRILKSFYSQAYLQRGPFPLHKRSPKSFPDPLSLAVPDAWDLCVSSRVLCLLPPYLLPTPSSLSSLQPQGRGAVREHKGPAAGWLAGSAATDGEPSQTQEEQSTSAKNLS